MVMVLAACEHLREQRLPVTVPASFHPLFGECYPADGGNQLRVFRQGTLLSSGGFEWLATSGGNWRLQILDPIGRVLIELRTDATKITKAGLLAAKVPEIEIREDGYLEVDGHFIGLKSKELPCIFGFKFPRSWMQAVYAIETGEKGTTLHVDDDDRDISIDIPAATQGPAAETCSQVSWTQFLVFFSSQLDLCFSHDPRDNAVLSGLEAIKLKWIWVDDE